MTEAIARVRHYLAMRDAQPLSQRADNIHTIHAGTQWEATLLLSDARKVVAEIGRLRAELAALREWCAKACESEKVLDGSESHPDPTDISYDIARDYCAAAIRSGGNDGR